MTKQIRVENADNSDHKVQVFIEDKLSDGIWQRRAGEPVALDYPTSMHAGYIHSTQRLVIEEAPAV